VNINSTLLDAKLFVLGGRKKGVHCPACGQYAKIYPRTIHKNMARGLLDYYRFDRRHPGEFMHVSQCCNHESSQLIWWDLLEEELVLVRARPPGLQEDPPPGHARLILPWDDRDYDDQMPLKSIGSLLP